MSDLSRALSALKPAVVTAAHKAFTEVKTVHSEENFYAFVLFTSPQLQYLVPSCNSEEALVCDGQAEMRWNPPDWTYHGVGEEHFAPVQDLLDEIDPPSLEDEEAERVHQVIWASFHDALADLDGGGLFGSGHARNQVLINVLWGDQDLPMHLESARRLNPREAFVPYAAHELPSLRSIVKALSRYPAARAKLAETKALIAEIESILG